MGRQDLPPSKRPHRQAGSTISVEERVRRVALMIAGTRLPKFDGDHERAEQSVVLDLRKALRGEAQFKEFVVDGKAEVFMDGPATFVTAMVPEWTIPLDDRTAENVAQVVQRGLIEARARNYDWTRIA